MKLSHAIRFTLFAFVLAAAAIVGNTLWSQPGQSALGIGVVLLGAPVYLWWKRRAPSP